jgi:hypothetical protein
MVWYIRLLAALLVLAGRWTHSWTWGKAPTSLVMVMMIRDEEVRSLLDMLCLSA